MHASGRRCLRTALLQQTGGFASGCSCLLCRVRHVLRPQSCRSRLAAQPSNAVADAPVWVQVPAPTLLQQTGDANIPARAPKARGASGCAWTRARVQYAVTRTLILRGSDPNPVPNPGAIARAGSAGKRDRRAAGLEGAALDPEPARPPAGAAGGARRCGLRAVQLLVARDLPLEACDEPGGRGGLHSLPALAEKVAALRFAP